MTELSDLDYIFEWYKRPRKKTEHLLWRGLRSHLPDIPPLEAEVEQQEISAIARDLANTELDPKKAEDHRKRLLQLFCNKLEKSDRIEREKALARVLARQFGPGKAHRALLRRDGRPGVIDAVIDAIEEDRQTPKSAAEEDNSKPDMLRESFSSLLKWRESQPVQPTKQQAEQRMAEELFQRETGRPRGPGDDLKNLERRCREWMKLNETGWWRSLEKAKGGPRRTL